MVVATATIESDNFFSSTKSLGFDVVTILNSRCAWRMMMVRMMIRLLMMMVVMETMMMVVMILV